MVEFVGENNLDALVDDLDVPFWVDERCEYRPALRSTGLTRGLCVVYAMLSKAVIICDMHVTKSTL